MTTTITNTPAGDQFHLKPTVCPSCGYCSACGNRPNATFIYTYPQPTSGWIAPSYPAHWTNSVDPTTAGVGGNTVPVTFTTTCGGTY